MGTETEREQKSAFNLCLKFFLHILPVTHGRPTMTFCLPNKMEEIIPSALAYSVLFFTQLEGAEVKRSWAEGEGGQVLCLSVA